MCFGIQSIGLITALGAVFQCWQHLNRLGVAFLPSSPLPSPSPPSPLWLYIGLTYWTGPFSSLSALRSPSWPWEIRLSVAHLWYVDIFFFMDNEYKIVFSSWEIQEGSLWLTFVTIKWYMHFILGEYLTVMEQPLILSLWSYQLCLSHLIKQTIYSFPSHHCLALWTIL